MDRKKYELFIAQLFLDMLEDLGVKIDSHSHILDFGCGEGWLVYQFRKKGLKAFGVDIINRFDNVQNLCREERVIRSEEDIFGTTDPINYRIPFTDNMFDIVVRDQVFEHVQNWPQALMEIKRVLKSNGASLHCFPSRYRPIEAHVFIPFAGIFQKRIYLAFWSFLGIRNSFQKQMGWKEVAHLNFEYLSTKTKYLRKKEIQKTVTANFGAIEFVEACFIKHHFGRIRRYLSFISRSLPLVSVMFSTFHTRVIFFKKQKVED